MTYLALAKNGTDVVSNLTKYLYGSPLEEWNSAQRQLDDLLYFYGRIFGGGLAHAIGSAADGTIPEYLRLIYVYGSVDLKSWAERLEKHFEGRVLRETELVREEWDASFESFGPDRDFDTLEAELTSLEDALQLVLCGYIEEHSAALTSHAE